MKPNLRSWLKSNPGKGVNDYYKEHPPEKSIESLNTGYSNQSSDAELYSFSRPNNQRNMDYAGTIASLFLMIGFFLPWFELSLFSVLTVASPNGMDVLRLLKLVYAEDPQIIPYSILLIPSLATAVLYFSLTGSPTKLLFQCISLIVFLYWAIQGWNAFAGEGVAESLLNILSVGSFMILLGMLYYLYDIFSSLFSTDSE